uniref:Uncharacterized protein n=1 Tax=Panagrolaimus sp. PS1159 TaxID=55785 RepID=A0AC35FCB3_9BILA
MEFDELLIQRKINKFGGYYFNGKPLSPAKRIEIIRQLKDGIGVTQIGRNLQISHGAVSKIVQNYRKTRSIEPKMRKPYARKVSLSPQKNECGFSVSEILIEKLPQKRRNNFTEDQKAVLLEYFEISPVPNQKRREEISKKTGLTDKQVLIWFNNRRSRIRKSLTAGVTSPSPSETTSVTSSGKPLSCESAIIPTQSSPSTSQITSSIPLQSLPISPMIPSPHFPFIPSPSVSNFTAMLQLQQILTAQYYLTTLMQQMPQK